MLYSLSAARVVRAFVVRRHVEAQHAVGADVEVGRCPRSRHLRDQRRRPLERRIRSVTHQRPVDLLPLLVNRRERRHRHPCLFSAYSMAPLSCAQVCWTASTAIKAMTARSARMGKVGNLVSEGRKGRLRWWLPVRAPGRRRPGDRSAVRTLERRGGENCAVMRPALAERFSMGLDSWESRRLSNLLPPEFSHSCLRTGISMTATTGSAS